MDLADLHIFKTVVEQGGVVKAARQLHRVQSNVTTRIKQLEASLGTQLFYRDRQRLVLSPSGELLLSYAERLLRLSEEARHAMSGSTPRGVLRVGALESTTASRLPALLAEYHVRHPEVRIELQTGTNDGLTAAVLARRVDAAFIAESPPSEELSSLPLFAERLVLITSLKHRKVRGPGDVEGDSIIAFPHGCAYRRRLQRWLGQDRTPAPRVLDLGSYHAIVACVASGAGIALVPESVLQTLAAAQVQCHRLPREHSHVVTPLVWRSGELSPALMALQSLLKDVVAFKRTGNAGATL
ncbi:MAG TPA: LysR family transcriptional regulator [Burkholderiaceae bacterium]|nr:LysR family transcriptional regulator [Burkholderiaceae bacterium]